MYYKLTNTLVAFTLLGLGGCSIAQTQNHEHVETTNSRTNFDVNAVYEQKQIAHNAQIQNEYDLSKQFIPGIHHKTLANYVEQMALDLVDTLESENDEDTPNINIAVTTLVDLDASLNNSNQLGNQISETLIHQLQKFGYSIVDFKTTDNIDVNSRGDFAFSRDIAKLSEDQMASHVLAGTLIYRHNGVIVNTNKNSEFRELMQAGDKDFQLKLLELQELKRWKEGVTKALWILFTGLAGVIIKLLSEAVKNG